MPPMALNLLRKERGFIALAVQFIYLPVYYAALSTAGPAGIASAQIIAGSYAPAMVFRWIFSLAGGGFLAYALFKQGDAPQLPPASWVYSALILALVGEFLGRYLFMLPAYPSSSARYRGCLPWFFIHMHQVELI